MIRQSILSSATDDCCGNSSIRLIITWKTLLEHLYSLGSKNDYSITTNFPKEIWAEIMLNPYIIYIQNIRLD